MTNGITDQPEVDVDVEISPEAAAYAVGFGITTFPNDSDNARRAAAAYLAHNTRPAGRRPGLRAAGRAVDLVALNRAHCMDLDDPWAPIFDDVPRPREVALTEFARRVVALDDVDGPGAQDRRTITLTKLIQAARSALGEEDAR